MTSSAPRLARTIKLWPLVLFGLAYITPFVVLSLFGIFSEISNGTLAGSYLLATVVLIFSALSYVKMSREYPVTGSAYTYARKAIDSRVGFMVGWAILLDYLFLPMVVWLITISYLGDQFPAVPKWAFLLVLIAITTVVNALGIKLATRANLLLIAFQALVILFFIIFSIGYLLDGNGAGTIISVEPFWNSGSTITALAAGAAITAYSFIGFDAVSTFAEETINPRKTVPTAILLTLLVAGLIFIALAYFGQLVHPGGAFENANTAPLDMAEDIGGNFFRAVFLATVIIAGITASIPIQAAGARLLYAMGRDGVLPKKFFGRLSSRFNTPVNNLLLMAAVGLLALILSLSTSTSFINFGAFTAFAFVNLSVIAFYWRNRKSAKRNVISWVIQPLLGLIGVIWLMFNLDQHALILGGIWLVAGFLWLLYVTRMFKREPPEVAMDDIPEMDASDGQKSPVFGRKQSLEKE